MYWTVKKVEPLEEYILLITFEGNVRKIFDMKPYLEYPLYSPLKSMSVFKAAHTNGETVVWNDEIDIAPETLYEKSLDYFEQIDVAYYAPQEIITRTRVANARRYAPTLHGGSLGTGYGWLKVGERGYIPSM